MRNHWQALWICCRMSVSLLHCCRLWLCISSPAVSCSCHWLHTLRNPYAVASGRPSGQVRRAAFDQLKLEIKKKINWKQYQDGSDNSPYVSRNGSAFILWFTALLWPPQAVFSASWVDFEPRRLFISVIFTDVALPFCGHLHICLVSLMIIFEMRHVTTNHTRAHSKCQGTLLAVGWSRRVTTSQSRWHPLERHFSLYIINKPTAAQEDSRVMNPTRGNNRIGINGAVCALSWWLWDTVLCAVQT